MFNIFHKYSFLFFFIISFPLYNYEIEESYTFNYILFAYKNHDYKRVIEISKKHSELKDNERIALNYILAHSYFNLKEYQNAITYFQKTLSVAPYKYEVLNNIGASYFYLKEYHKALKYFKQSIQENPNYTIAQKNFSLLSDALYESNKKNKDIDNLKLFSLSSKTVNDVNLAWLYYYMGNTVDSIYLLKKALKENPDYTFAYVFLGYIYDSTSNYKTALKYYKKALAIDNEYPDLWNDIGITYFNLGDYDNAIKHFEKAYDLNPKFSYPLNNLGFLYLSKRDFKKALLYFNKVIAIEHSNPLLLSETYAGIAICKFFENDKETAKVYKSKSLELNDNLSSTDYLLKYLNWDNEMIKIYSDL